MNKRALLVGAALGVALALYYGPYDILLIGRAMVIAALGALVSNVVAARFSGPG